MISCDIEDFDGYNSLKGTSRVFVYLSEQNQTKQYKKWSGNSSTEKIGWMLLIPIWKDDDTKQSLA